MQTETRKRARIGVLVPYTNTNLEPDMELLRPPDTTVHFARMAGYDINEVPGSDQMAGLGASDMSDALMMISAVRPDAVIYGCTSATLTHGTGFDADLAARIRDGSGALSFTAAGSLVAALQVLAVTRVGFASPYLGEINDQAVAFLADNGIATVKCHDIGRPLGNYGQGELSPDDVFELALCADHDDAEAIVLSCTDMRSVEVIERLEQALGKPVVTSNQSMMFNLMRALGLPRHERLPGKLFERL
ncbi:MAG: Asp/Glu racemase [Pseudomonadota bacterium]